LLVENLTNYSISSEDVNCVVDGVAQNNYYYSGHSELPFNISKGLTVKGTATFIVPKNAKGRRAERKLKSALSRKTLENIYCEKILWSCVAFVVAIVALIIILV
jgi:hypothetical protein